MKLPRPRDLGEKLRVWREKKGLSVKDVVNKSKNSDVCQKPFAAGDVSKWETKKSLPTYRRLVRDIFPAYEIDDISEFLLEITPEYDSINDVIHITRDKISIKNDPELCTRSLYIDPHYIQKYPLRVDFLYIESNKCSEWRQHKGCEYLLVTKGQLNVMISESEDNINAISYELNEGDAIAFSGHLFHKLQVTKGERAKIVVGRPVWSGREVEP